MSTHTVHVRLNDRQMKTLKALADTLAEEVFLTDAEGAGHQHITLRLALDRGMRALREEFGRPTIGRLPTPQPMLPLATPTDQDTPTRAAG